MSQLQYTLAPTLPTVIFHEERTMSELKKTVICYDCLNKGVKSLFFHKRDLANHKLDVHGIDMSVFQHEGYTFRVQRDHHQRKRGYWIKIYQELDRDLVYPPEFITGHRFTEVKEKALAIIDTLVKGFNQE